MAFTDIEIRQKALQLEKAGAPLSDIEEFVKRAKSEQGTQPLLPQNTPQPTVKNKSFLQKAGEFVAPLGRVFGESIAQKEAVKLQAPITAQNQKYTNMVMERLKTTTDPERRSRLIRSLQLAGQTQTVPEQTPGYGTTTKQVIGAGLSTLGSAISGGSIAGKGLVSRAVENVAGGAVFGAGGAMEQNAGLKQTLGSALLGGGIGAGGSLVGGAISKVANKVPENAWSNLLKQTGREGTKNPNLAKQAASLNLFGTRKQISEKLGTLIQDAEVKLDDLLQKKGNSISPATLSPYLDELRSTYAKIPGEGASVKVIDNIKTDLLSLGKQMSVADANKLKRSIYKVVEDSYGKGLLEAPAKIEAQKIVASGIRKEIEKVVPEVRNVNKQQGIYLEVKQAIDKSIERTKGKGFFRSGVGLLDLVTGAGISVGSGLQGGLLTIGLLRAGKTAPILSGASLGAKKLVSFFNTLSPTRKILFYQFLNSVSPTSSQDQEE